MFNDLAMLSRLQFSREEKAGLMRDLEKMIGFVQQLQEVDTTGIKPLWYMGTNSNVLRDDELAQMLEPSEALENAMHKTKDFFLVPKVIQKP